MLPWDHAQAWSDSLSAQPPGHRDQRCGPRFHAIPPKCPTDGEGDPRVRSYDDSIPRRSRREEIVRRGRISLIGVFGSAMKRVKIGRERERHDDLGNVKQGGSTDADTSQQGSVSSGWTVDSGCVCSTSRGHEASIVRSERHDRSVSTVSQTGQQPIHAADSFRPMEPATSTSPATLL